ncbi:DUF4286 family protein [Sphingobium sp. Sx8-8]|uniref:DUF4286 family protein n=1 Tax=Sphingobium sp. Sx8-8 TaxID=2933617 RepID=UPI001F59ABC7|nr:DUF4286 family protein [Sphingobium sp. Sx8-8]
MAEHVFVVLTNPVEGREEEYNRWYDEVHLGEVLDVPGFVAARRYRVAPSAGAVTHRYLALYHIDSDDVAASMAELNRRAGSGEMQMSDALDGGISPTLYEALPLSDKLRKSGR